MAAVLHDNLADDAAVLAGTQVVTTPATMVQNEHVARKWRSRLSSDYLLFDFGASTAIDTVAAIGLTATTCRVRLSTADSSGAAGDAWDTGVVAVDQGYLQVIALGEATASGRYLRIDLVNAAGDYVECGRVAAGVRSTFTYNFAFGWGRAWVDPSLRTKTRGGQTQISREENYRTLELPFEIVSTDDRHGFVETMDRVNGLSTDVLFVTDDGSANLARDSVWGLVADVSPVTQPFFDTFAKTYRIEERL
ncbi:MAG: hypothetical protein AB7I42_24835 [Bradyrhizobium sp.]|uniref:hypothetical protein n=1 Tax=Bradyrhizobium sp. TaxID=376 RepID=UPI003D12C039